MKLLSSFVKGLLVLLLSIIFLFPGLALGDVKDFLKDDYSSCLCKTPIIDEQVAICCALKNSKALRALDPLPNSSRVKLSAHAKPILKSKWLVSLTSGWGIMPTYRCQVIIDSKGEFSDKSVPEGVSIGCFSNK